MKNPYLAVEGSQTAGCLFFSVHLTMPVVGALFMLTIQAKYFAWIAVVLFTGGICQ